jgi:hypothetical protein
MIVYEQPAQGIDKDGKSVTCTEKVSVTREDAACIARYALQQRLAKKLMDDGEMITEYMIVHWAREEK